MSNEDTRLGVINETMTANLNNLKDMLHDMSELRADVLHSLNHAYDVVSYSGDPSGLESMKDCYTPLINLRKQFESALPLLDMIQDEFSDFQQTLEKRGVDLTYDSEPENSWKSFAQFVEEDFGGGSAMSPEDYARAQDSYQAALERHFEHESENSTKAVVDELQQYNEESGADSKYDARDAGHEQFS